MKKTAILCVVMFAFVLSLCSTSPAQAKPDKPQKPDNSTVNQKAIDKAVKKGVKWLAKEQQPDGSFRYRSTYSMGMTALAMLAMLKSEVGPKSPAILRGFKYLETLPLERTYSVAVYVMAFEALYAPSKKQMNKTMKKYTTLLRENLRKKAPKRHKKIINKCLKWIVSNQKANVWRYPKMGEDLSNTQYALLALQSGMRMGYKTSPRVFKKAAEYLIVNQEKKGPEVEPFPVPAADFSIKNLKGLENKIREKLKESQHAGRSEAGKTGKNPDKPRTVVVEDPYSRFGVERRKHKMFARGWSYMAKGPEGPSSNQCSGSMTTAGLACSVIVKAGMENSSLYTKRYKELINKCIRDSAAWLAKNFSVTDNLDGTGKTAGSRYLYYYLYGLERAGALTLCACFGEHDWYNKGAKFILRQQKPEGYWHANPSRARQPGKASSFQDPSDTCFALLFLKRGTVPVISIPSQIYTGGDLFGDKKNKQKMPGKSGNTEKAEQPKQQPSAPDEDSKKDPSPQRDKKDGQTPQEPKK